MGAALPVNLPDVYQTEVHLVNKRSGLKGVTTVFAGHVTVRGAMQFLVHQRSELIEGLLITCAPGLQQ
jgi:hypothetical protein